MARGRFPLSKLVTLISKRIAKTLAKKIKFQVANKPAVAKYIVHPPVYFYHWLEFKTKQWAMELGTASKLPKLDDETIHKLGANLLEEVLIVFFGSAILMFEYMRQKRKEDRIKQIYYEDKHIFEETITDILFRIETQDAQIRELTRKIIR